MSPARGASAGTAAAAPAPRVDAAGRTWIPGIGEPLPAGERVLWVGSPERGAIARRVFKTRTLSAYFLALVGFVFVAQAPDVGGRAAAFGTLVVVAMAGSVLAFCRVFAALIARSSVYAITDRRLVLRIGVAIPAVLNVPLDQVASVDLRRDEGGTGDVVVTLAGTGRIAYLLLWPHARPWRFAQPQPALRCVADAPAVGATLACAVQARLEALEAIAEREAVDVVDAAGASVLAPVGPRPATGRAPESVGHVVAEVA